jgi:hypothetical protein
MVWTQFRIEENRLMPLLNYKLKNTSNGKTQDKMERWKVLILEAKEEEIISIQYTDFLILELQLKLYIFYIHTKLWYLHFTACKMR